MARDKGAEYDWDKRPTTDRQLYPTGDFLCEVVTCDDTQHSTGGKIAFSAEARIVEVGKNTRDFEDQPVFLNFYPGTDDDPDAEDPATWSNQRNFGAASICEFEVGCGVTKGKGPGPHPRDLFLDCEGKRVLIHMGRRVQKKGDYAGTEQQTYKFYRPGDREPGLLADGNAPPAKRESRQAAPEPEPRTRREREPAPEAAEPDEDERPRRRARA